jgi:hypothetical protein
MSAFAPLSGTSGYQRASPSHPALRVCDDRPNALLIEVGYSRLAHINIAALLASVAQRQTEGVSRNVSLVTVR